MVTLQNLMSKLLAGTVKSNETTEKVIVRIYPKVYKTANLGLVSRILEKESYVLLLDKQGMDLFSQNLSNSKLYELMKMYF